MRRKKPIPASLRLQVIDRDNGRCRACGIGDRDALQADHIVGVEGWRNKSRQSASPVRRV